MSPFARTWALWAEWGTRVLSFVSVCGEGVAEARRGGSVPLPRCSWLLAGSARSIASGILDLSRSDLLSDECLGPVTESWGVKKAMKMDVAEQRLRRCSELEGKIKS